MHVSAIQYPSFYEEALGGQSGAAQFVKCVQQIPASVSLAKIVVHQAARLTWLADRMDECAAERPALQILFFIITAEAVGKLVAGFEDDGESKRHVRMFFEEICSDSSRRTLSKAFSTGIAHGFVSVREAVDFLYRIRCDVAHRGRYFTYSLKEEGGVPMMTPDGDGFLIAHVTAGQLRQIVLEGALLGAAKLLPTTSHCRELLRV